jgi:uncharacterized repeat protein (TIGR03803 family)
LRTGKRLKMDQCVGKLVGFRSACAVVMLCAATTIASSAQTFKTRLNFNVTNGAWPYASLVQGTDGKLYGTTAYGGNTITCGLGCGTAYRITASGTLTTLYSFCPQSGCHDGASPGAGLVQAIDGNFYGTTNLDGVYGAGALFQLTSKGALTTLYSFCLQTNCTDGSLPLAGLVQATDYKLYGTTAGGGAYNGSGGTVFNITSGGKLTTLYSFCLQTNCTDGRYPQGELVQATDGSFYGTTGAGGTIGEGAVFEITSSRNLTTLYSFCHDFPQCSDGKNPAAGLIQATDGNFYGTTVNGGSSSNCVFGCGTVFKITPKGLLTTLHSFDKTDGFYPYAGLVQGTDGNFYGTTVYGGSSSKCGQDGCGTVFKITAKGALTTLHGFDDTDGSYPYAGLMQATSGSFYGVTQGGGNLTGCGGVGCGTVFSLSVGLRSFVTTRPTSGKIGASVIILGTNLAGTTSVHFNGTAAKFTVVSKSEIKTVVPVGATTGTVKVETPSHTLSSNVPFRVTKN